jgi:hypothetical protein
MKNEFSTRFQKNPNIKFHENPSKGAELFHADRWLDGCTDRYDAADSHFSQFCKCA